jgi:hypothetical protein
MSSRPQEIAAADPAEEPSCRYLAGLAAECLQLTLQFPASPLLLTGWPQDRCPAGRTRVLPCYLPRTYEKAVPTAGAAATRALPGAESAADRGRAGKAATLIRLHRTPLAPRLAPRWRTASAADTRIAVLPGERVPRLVIRTVMHQIE